MIIIYSDLDICNEGIFFIKKIVFHEVPMWQYKMLQWCSIFQYSSIIFFSSTIWWFHPRLKKLVGSFMAKKFMTFGHFLIGYFFLVQSSTILTKKENFILNTLTNPFSALWYYHRLGKKMPNNFRENRREFWKTYAFFMKNLCIATESRCNSFKNCNSQGFKAP